MKLLCMRLIVVNFVIAQTVLAASVGPDVNVLKPGKVTMSLILGGSVDYDNAVPVTFATANGLFTETLGTLRKYIAGRIKDSEAAGYKKANDISDKKIKELKNTLSDTIKKLAKVEATLADIDQKNTKIVTALQQERDELRIKISSLKDDFERVDKNFRDTQKKYTIAQGSLDGLRIQYDELQKSTASSLLALQENLNSSVLQVSDLTESLSVLRQEHETLKTDYFDSQKQYEELQLLYAELEQLHAACQQQIDALHVCEVNNNELENLYQELMQQHDVSLQEVIDLQAELLEAQTAYDSTAQQVVDLQQELVTLHAACDVLLQEHENQLVPA